MHEIKISIGHFDQRFQRLQFRQFFFWPFQDSFPNVVYIADFMHFLWEAFPQKEFLHWRRKCLTGNREHSLQRMQPENIGKIY